eukprot:8829237-Pyramimonas_sp.AAC.2
MHRWHSAIRSLPPESGAAEDRWRSAIRSAVRNAAGSTVPFGSDARSVCTPPDPPPPFIQQIETLLYRHCFVCRKPCCSIRTAC